MNELLITLEEEGYKVIAYADDIAIAVSGKHPETLRDLMETALARLVKWTVSCGLSANPAKTELILFTKRHKIP